MEETTKEIQFKPRTRVFIVEDEHVFAEDLKFRLEKRGYEVVGVADSGQTAIDEIKTTMPDVVLMDVRIFGELNGIEVAIIIQTFSTEPIPVVFLTAFSEKSFGYLKVLENYIYINKPISDSQLFDALKRALNTDPPRVESA